MNTSINIHEVSMDTIENAMQFKNARIRQVRRTEKKYYLVVSMDVFEVNGNQSEITLFSVHFERPISGHINSTQVEFPAPEDFSV